MNIEGGEVGQGAAPGVLELDAAGPFRCGWQVLVAAVQRLELGLRAPRGAALPDGGERTPSLVCRSRLGKLRAARTGRRR